LPEEMAIQLKQQLDQTQIQQEMPGQSAKSVGQTRPQMVKKNQGE